jgi:hypothetical protein
MIYHNLKTKRMNKLKLKVFSDGNDTSPVLNEFISLHSHVDITDDINIADIALILNSDIDIIRLVNDLLLDYKKLKIIIECTPYDFNSDRVYMLNTKMRDMCMHLLVNNTRGLTITHIDIHLVHLNLNLNAEIMNGLSLVAMILGWDTYIQNKLTLTFSYNKYSAHVSGTSNELNFTLSILVSNTGHDEFNETVKIFTKSDGIFILDNDIHNHSYGERYGAAIQTILFDTMQNNFYYQHLLKSVIESCRSDSALGGYDRLHGGLKRTRTR